MRPQHHQHARHHHLVVVLCHTSRMKQSGTFWALLVVAGIGALMVVARNECKQESDMRLERPMRVSRTEEAKKMRRANDIENQRSRSQAEGEGNWAER